MMTTCMSIRECATENIKVSVVTVSNIKKDYFIAHQAQILDAVRQDVAYVMILSVVVAVLCADSPNVHALVSPFMCEV